MSVACYIVLDKNNPGFDTFVNGKYIAHVWNSLSAFCVRHGLNTPDDFLSQDAAGFLDDFELEQSELLWFEPQTGIEWIDSLTENLQSDSVNFDKESVLLELDEYRTVLKQAEKNKMKWRFELDV